MKTKISNYLCFLTGTDFSINDENGSEPKIDLSKSCCASLHHLQQNKALEYKVQYDSEGSTLTSLNNINFELLQKMFQIKFNAGLYLFAQLLNIPLNSKHTAEEGVLEIPAMQNNVNDLLSYLSQQNALQYVDKKIEGKMIRIIRWFDLNKMQQLLDEKLNERIDFFTKILNISFVKPPLLQSMSVENNQDDVIAKLSSTEIKADSNFTKWLLQELDWLQQQGYCSFAIETKDDKIIIHLQNITDAKLIKDKQLTQDQFYSQDIKHYQKLSILAHNPECHYRDALSLQNCLAFMLRIDKWIHSLSNNFLSDIISNTDPYFIYAIKKIQELKDCIQCQVLPESDNHVRIQLKITDRKKLISATLKKLFLGTQYCSIISGSDILARFCSKNFIFANTEIIFPHLYLINPEQAYLKDKCQNNLRILVKKSEQHSNALGIWFDEQFLSTKALEIYTTRKALLDKILGVKFEIDFSTSTNDSDKEIKEIVECIEKGISYKLKHLSLANGIVYSTPKLTRETASKTIKQIKELEKAGIITWSNEPGQQWGLSQKPNIPESLQIQILDEEKLMSFAKKQELPDAQTRSKAQILR